VLEFRKNDKKIKFGYQNKMIEAKIKKNIIEIVNLHEADDSGYFHDRSPLERLEVIEFMRKAMFGHDRVSARLQRVLTVTELKED
jgi:hypothetical protein